MNTNDLRKILNTLYEVNKEYPETYPVSPETYGNVCQDLFDHVSKIEGHISDHVNGIVRIKIALGPNNGILFKNVELIKAKA